MRAETTAFDPYFGMTHTCIVVFPDGHYRLERSFQNSSSTRPDDKVYVDVLPEASVKQLQAILDDEKFEQIQTDKPRGGIVQEMDTLSVSIPREHRLQNMSFVNAAERKPYERQLKPLFTWMKDTQKRKVQVAKKEIANNCEVPMVMYRSTSSSQAEIEGSPKQP